MTLAERLLRIVEAAGFQRMKRFTRRGIQVWEIWVGDGVTHIFEGPSLEDALAQAEGFIAGRRQ